MSESDQKDFFISYNKADKGWAEWIAWELEAAGYSVVIHAWDFLPGCNFVLEMHRAQSISARTIAVLSPNYLASLYTMPEWAAAFAQDPTSEKGILTVVRVRECEMTGLLSRVGYIDLVGLNDDEARKKLLAGVIVGRRKPYSPPTFPGVSLTFPADKSKFSTTLPTIWNIPHNRNPNFTGREELLEKLHQALIQGQGAALTQAVAGLGGVGKTQIAVEFAYRFASEYDLVWWLRAEDPATLAADYAALAGPLDLPEKGVAQQDIIVAAVRQKLWQINKWLLIFDHANEPKELKNYLVHAGHIIITSRHQAWGGVGKMVRVTEWERGEAKEFILKRTGNSDAAAAEELAKELGNLPLALEQAGAYIEECGCTISQYLDLFRERRQELLRLGQLSQEYPDNVATTWKLSFEKVKQESPAAADLLNLCAFLSPDDIPLEMLKMGAVHLPERLVQAVNQALEWNDMRAALGRYSLMGITDDDLSMHRLVQAVVRDRLISKEKKEWAKVAVELVNATFPGGNLESKVETWPLCARLLPHALISAEHAENFQVALLAAGQVLNKAGFYLRIRAEFDLAKTALIRALAINEAVFGPDHPDVANGMNNLGKVLQDLGDLAGARAHFERALTIDEAAYGPSDPNVARDVNNLGSVLQDLGDLEGARAHFERALVINQATFGPNHPEVATVVNNLGSVLRGLGEPAKAKNHFERALVIDEAVYGPNNPVVAVDVNNLGSVLQDLGEPAKAKNHFERALAIDEAAYGPNHPRVAIRLNNLGSVLQDLGDLEEAKYFFERALAIDEAAYGPNHFHVAIRLNNLGSVLKALGDQESARAHYERSLKIIILIFGSEHSLTKKIKKNLQEIIGGSK